MPKVSDAIRLVERDGWFHVRTNGSHRIYIHPDKSGRVHSWSSLPTGTGKGNKRVLTLEVSNAIQVIEKSDNGYAAYVPDLPGCIAMKLFSEEVMPRLG